MKKLYTFMLATAAFAFASAGEVTDVISASTITIPEIYEEQEITLVSDAVYLVTLKDDGNGPQFKAGSSGIVTKETGGKLKRVEVAWGSKSNEGIAIYGQATPYGSSSTLIEGTLIGTIDFSAGSTVGVDIEGDWEFIGITSTAEKGKAAAFGSISIIWATDDETVDEPCDGVIISEVCGDDATTDGHEDWVEIYNPTSAALDLSGVKVQKTDEDGVQEIICTIADGTTLAADEYFVVEKGTDFTSGISNSKNVTITLISPLDKRLSMFDKVAAFTHNGSHLPGGSYSLDEATGKWAITTIATKGAANNPYPEVIPVSKWYAPVSTAAQLADGTEVIFVNVENGYVMSYDWDTTKDGGVYLYGYKSIQETDGDNLLVDIVAARPAVVTLCDGDDGTWALKFGETNNYLNDSRYLACTEFKNMDFKKKDDVTKGTRATITFNAGGDAEIDFGEGGVIKFNLKNETSSRFFNYDPADKPDEHLAVTLYTATTGSGVESVAVDAEASSVYYNLQGMQISEPKAGQTVIVRTGRTARKIVF